MKQLSNPHINELNGYLKCISRLRPTRSSFYATAYEAKGEIDDLISELVGLWSKDSEYVTPSKYEYTGKEEIDSHALFNEIEKYVFQGVLDRENIQNEKASAYLTRTLIEDINEYYGVVSTTQNKDGEFHPLLGTAIYRLNIKNESYSNSFYFIKKIAGIYVLTCFRNRK
jgi:hypothetical protein